MLAKINYKVNSKIRIAPEPINGQGVGEISKCRYGLFPASFNGCEMIAIYNLLLLKGYKGHSFADICLEMYPKTWALWGLLGSDVYRLHKYFTKRNIKTKRYFAFSQNECFEEIDKNGAGIISFWNAKNPFKGIHTVCVEKTENGYRVYNRYNNKDYPYDYGYHTEITKNIRFLSGYIIT